jgi:hypothetical protein
VVTHTSTDQWQSFEGRMRRRRAERLVLRADVAADAGCLDEAREALEEARKLVPTLHELDRIQRKIETPIARPVTIEAVAPSVAQPVVIEEEAAPTPEAHGARKIVVAAAAIAFLAGGAGVLVYVTSRAHPLQPTQEFRDAVQLIAAPDASPAVARTPDAATAAPPPTPADLEPPLVSVPVPVPVSTTGSGADSAEAARYVQPPERAIDRSPRIVPASLNSSAGMPASIPSPSAVAAPPAVSDTPAAPALERVGARDTSEALKPPTIATDTLTATPGLAAAPEPVVSQDALVRAALDRYAAAYSALDADAAQRVWPGVNRAALSRAFESLASQRVSLGSCNIDVSGATAQARCAGSTTWQPKVGSGETKTDRRAWTFGLARSAGGWEIVSARVQNR